MEKESKVLVVDDDQFALRSMAKVLGSEIYEVVTATGGSEAIDLLKQEPFDLVLTDLKMPEVDGLEVLRQAREIAPQTVVLILTGYASLESAIEALREGAYDYLLKPCSADELKLKIERGLERGRLAEEHQRAQEALQKAHHELEIRVKERTAELAKANEELQIEIAQRKRAEEELRQSQARLGKTLEGTVNALVSAIEMGDPYTPGHPWRVTQLACAMAREMGLLEEQIKGIRMAGLIHDLGKISVPAQILSKPGPLTELEYGLIKAHPQIGYEVLKTIEFVWPVAQILLQHHERMDGSGYPAGLSGEDILLEARILAVADVVEAMISDRPYRLALDIKDALEEISQNRGVLYDPEVVNACLRLFTEKGFTFEEVRRDQ
jgi:response regulator RpfG family c-di-GMP phosphodiesterase